MDASNNTIHGDQGKKVKTVALHRLVQRGIVLIYKKNYVILSVHILTEDGPVIDSRQVTDNR